jgi:hypothetical protein
LLAFSIPNTDIEIRVTHTSFDEGAQRKVQSRSARTNPEGLVVIIPYTRLKPGLWELSCLPDPKSTPAKPWQYGVQLEVLPAESETSEPLPPIDQTEPATSPSHSENAALVDRRSPTNRSIGRSARTSPTPSSRGSTAADQNLPIPHSPNPRTQTGRQTRTRPRSRNLRHPTRSPLNHFRQNRHSPTPPKNRKNSNSHPRIRSARTQTTHRFSTTANLPARPPNLKNSRRNPAADARTSSPLHLCLRHLHPNRVQKPPNIRRSNSQQRQRHPSHQTIHNYSPFRAPARGN